MSLTRSERRQLREIERSVDREWARAAFGGPSTRDRRRQVVVRAVADVAAVTVLVLGALTVSMPALFAGTVLANVALCCHLAGPRSRPRAARRGSGARARRRARHRRRCRARPSSRYA
ncbi:DUF3040 domain-containing protein [Amycolatopsis sp. NPDC051903]|uniref:DUF3040 domain-containing protein n=1 Tax=Amycolatopsis sp. NPDC051903 TaxID=3363936 RepID=UPI0037943627